MSLSYLENRNNVSTTPWTADLVERLKVLWAEGYSATQVVNELKVDGKITRSAVIGKVHRLGLPRRKPRQPAQYRTRASYRGSKPAKPLAPQPPKPPRPQPQPGALKMRELSLFKLKPYSSSSRNHCRWPLASLQEVAHKFCAADTQDGEIYCPAHMRTARVRRKDDG